MNQFSGNGAWRDKEFVRKYIEDFRGAIPYAVDHIEVMLDAIRASNRNVKNFADIGCGNGILAGAILLRYPEACGTLVDFYEPVLNEAKQQLLDHVSNINFVTADLMDPRWIKNVKKNIPFDVIVSGFTIHHIPDRRKKELYKEIFKMLKPGGIFINIEQIAPESKLISAMADNAIIESLRKFHKKRGMEKSVIAIRKEYIEEFSSKENTLASCKTHMKWLENTGFSEVSLFFKAYAGTVFGGIKPKLKTKTKLEIRNSKKSKKRSKP
ncbi:MAG: class I SAM-dependent methyltransferase [Candidatus Firestonebacteria bacterium]